MGPVLAGPVLVVPGVAGGWLVAGTVGRAPTALAESATPITSITRMTTVGNSSATAPTEPDVVSDFDLFPAPSIAMKFSLSEVAFAAIIAIATESLTR
jgi:hypothetical protein